MRTAWIFQENENADGDLKPELPAGEKEQQNLMENKFSEEFLESLAMCDEKLLENIWKQEKYPGERLSV